MIHEPAVTLSDYLLVVECVLCAVLSWRRAGAWELRTSLTAVFAGTGAAAFLGGTVHGFFPEPGSLGRAVLWPATLLAIGAAALALWWLAIEIACPGARRAMLGFVAAYAAYALVVLFGPQLYLVAIVGYLPAILFLLAAFIAELRSSSDERRVRAARLGAAGVGVSLLAAGIQQSGVVVGGIDHNTLYHLLQAVGLWLLFLAGRGYLAPSAPGSEARSAPAT